jgi:excisionase family DNA binding protein
MSQPSQNPSATEATTSGAGQKPAPAVKKRCRLKLETRRQLLERLKNPLLSLHEASILLGVCRTTVRRYSDSGQLAHIRSAGGQRRFYLSDVEALYKELR